MTPKIMALALFAFGISAAVAWAGADSQVHPQACGTLEKWSINITAERPNNPGTPGPCTGGAGFANHCPSGNCTCMTSTGTASGTAGSGPVTVYETIDNGQEFTPGGSVACSPAYGDIEVQGSQFTDSIAVFGGDCLAILGARQLPEQENFDGACGVQVPRLFCAQASGACDGTYSIPITAADNITLKLSINGTAIENGNSQ
jgi:hypothetical protein